MPYSPIKVANELLALAGARVPPRLLTPLQLIKLVYIAHGWSLHFFHRPMVNEPAQAWRYGPVVPTLYHAIRGYRASPVTALIPGDSDPQLLSEQDRSLLSSVYRAYGHLSGTQLSNMTHTPGTPWSEVWATAGQNAIIPDEMIAEHYDALAARRQQAGAGANAD